MRNILSIAFIALVLTTSFSVLAPLARAQAVSGSCTAPDGKQGHYEPAGSTNCVSGAVSPAAAATTAAKNTPVVDTIPTVDGDSYMAPVMNTIMKIFAWLLGVAAITLDNTVYYTVVTMGSVVNNLSAVGVAWRVLRDIGNIILIFGFLAIGICIILEVKWYGGGYHMLPVLLFAAVALNFSLFISEAVIDTGNLFATQFYTQINGGKAAGGKNLSDITSEGISQKILAQLGFPTIYGDAQHKPELFTPDAGILVNFMGVILFMVTAFVFFSLAFILIARFVVLVFLVILSPVGIAGLAMPKLEGYARKWWDQLFMQTITAPILLLMLYIALAVITDVNFLTGFGAASGGWTGLASGHVTAFAGTMLSFLIAMGLLLAVTLLAKNLSAFGSSQAMKWGGRLSFGAASYATSGLLGGSAFALRRGIVQRFNPTSDRGRATQRLASRVLRYGEGVRMDARRLPGVGAGLNFARADEASAPIDRSAVARAQQGRNWWQTSGQEANRQFDQETRMPRLRAAITANDSAAIGRILGNMSDKELEESSVQRLIASNPAAAATLTQARFDKLLVSDALSDAQKNNLRTQREQGLIARYTDATVFHNPATHPTAPGATIPSIRHPGTPMSSGEQAVRGLTNEAAGQLPDAVLTQPDVHQNLSIRQLNAIQNAGRIQNSTAETVGAHLQTDPDFAAYYRTRNPQQRADMREYWAIPVSATFPV